MPTARLYHNADCSKCRAALALLRERGIEVEVIDYLERPPSVDELRQLVARLGVPVTALVRTVGGEPEAAALAAPDADPDAVLRALSARPQLLQRPILVVGERAVIARPAERILELL